MKPEAHPLTRREALLNALKGSLVAAVTVPVVLEAEINAPTPPPEPEYVPENDYPFFGYEPDSVA